MIERRPVPANALRLEQGKYPSKLLKPGERTDMQLRLGLVKYFAEEQGLQAPEGLEKDSHFWGLVLDTYLQNHINLRKKTETTFKKSKKTTIEKFSRQIALMVAVNHAKILIEKEREKLTDSLTGVWSRYALDTYMTHLINSSKQPSDQNKTKNQDKTGFLFVDADEFKSVNDSEGHEAGDQLLIALAQTIKAKTREEQDMVARYGGDEFAVIFPGMPSVERLADKAEEIRKAIKLVVGKTVSIGIAIIQDDDDSPKNVYKRADLGLYAAKDLGRDRSVMYVQGEVGFATFADFSTGKAPIQVIGHLEETPDGRHIIKAIGEK